MRECDEIEIAEWPEAATVCGDGAIMEAFDPFIDGHATLLVRRLDGYDRPACGCRSQRRRSTVRLTTRLIGQGATIRSPAIVG
jgi:hypothetical protein